MANISQIKLPNGDTHNFIDTASGYTKNTGTITSVKTTAGAHTAINVSSGAVSFNVPTTAAHVGIKFGYTTSGNNRAVLQDSSGNLYVTQKDDNTNTTYTLSGALSSHKFTSTLTAGGSGNGTSTSELTFAAGTGITLTDDATNKKITIAASHNGTVTSVAASGSGGITISGSPITSSGTITIGLNLSTAINGLSEGTAPAQLNDYAVVQYAGGGTTTTSYHRRKLTNLIVGKAVADQNGDTINTTYLKLTGGNVTGPVNFGDTVSIDDLNAGQLVVSGSASFANNLQANTINGVAVGNNPKFTDTVTTATTTGSGNAVTAITASNGALTVTKGTTFLTSHNTYTVSTTGTGNAVTAVSLSGTTFTVTKGATYSNNAGTITSVKTTAGAHTAINTTSGAVSFNVPTTAAHVGIKFGYTTSGNNRAVLQDSSGNLYVTQKDDNSGGTVTKVTAGTGLSIGSTAGGNFTTTGTINHTNAVTAQTTQAVYPIKIDAQGHISAYGSAQTILTIGTGASNAAAGNHTHSYLPLSGGTLTGRVTTDDPINQLITGSGTAASDKGSGANPRYFPAKWTFNTGQTATDGDIITIEIPEAGHSYGVFLSIDNGSHYHPVVVGNGTGRITTHYGKSTPIQLIFDSGGSAADMYALNGANTRATVTGGVWRVLNYYTDGNTYTQALCTTAAATAAKAASMSYYVATAKRYVMVNIYHANTSATALTLNINSTGAKPIYINGSASSTSNHTLPAGSYLVYYDGTNYYFRTDGHLQSADGILTSNAGTVTSITLTQGTGISIGSSGTAITTSGTRTIALATSGVTAGTYGAQNNSDFVFSGGISVPILGVKVDTYGRVTATYVKDLICSQGDIICANAASSTSTSIPKGTITQIPLTNTLVSSLDRSNLALASNRITITYPGTYRITGSIYITTTAAASVGVYVMKGSGAFSNATEIASSYIYEPIAGSYSINVTKTIEKTGTTAEYVYLAGRSSNGGTVAAGNTATYLEVQQIIV